jgi:hypothetical protein
LAEAVDQVLLKEIRQIHRDRREAYGAIKTWQVLRQAVLSVANTEWHSCALAAIEARRKRKFRLAYQARHSTQRLPRAGLLWAPAGVSVIRRIRITAQICCRSFRVTAIARRSGANVNGN